MNRQIVAKTWIYSGMRDIFFAFDKDDEAFTYNTLFSEIMGFEKVIKAVLLFERYNEYEALDFIEAKIKINEIAKLYGHDFNKMLSSLSLVGISQIDQIKKHNFDGYLGIDLILAIKAGYMETRYPVPVSISDSFPIKGTSLKHDPLWSSGISKFIYAICEACLNWLTSQMSLDELWCRFQNDYQHKESLRRFNNLFWTSREMKNLFGV